MNKYYIHNLEYNLSHACNLKCNSCDHLSPYFKPDDKSHSEVNPESFEKSISILSKYVKVEDFLLLGGEPLINKEILEYIDIVKKYQFVQNVVLVTNGFLLAKQPDELYKKIDRIEVSTYESSPLSENHKQRIKEKAAQLNKTVNFNHVAQFHKSIVAKKHPKFLARMFFYCCGIAWKNKCYTLYNGMLSRCSRIPFISWKLKEASIINEEFFKEDCLLIEDKGNFNDIIKVYFNSTDKTPYACYYCLGGYGKPQPHKQLSTDEIENESWKQEKTWGSFYLPKLFRRYFKRTLTGKI